MNRGHSRQVSGDGSASPVRRVLLVAVAVALAAAMPYVAAAELHGPSVDPTPDAINDTPNETTDGVTDPADNATDGVTNGTGGPADATNATDRASDAAGNATDAADGPADAGNATAGQTRGNATGVPDGTASPNATVHSRVVRADHAANTTTVNVTVSVDRPNVTVPVNLTRPATRDDPVAVDALDVSLERGANFTLEVTNSPEPIPNRTPAFDTPANGTVGLGFLGVNHSVPDAAIENVTFTFRVSKARLNDSEVGDVALYRYHDGSWNELPTEPAGETDTHYVFRAESPGLSEFAAGKKTASFEIRNATVTVTRLRAGDDVQVRVRITNTGGADGTFDATLRLDGDVVATRQLTIAANGTRQTTFERAISRPGTYDVTVNEFPVGSVHVEGSDAATASSEDSTAVTSGQPGFGAAQAALAAVVAALAAARHRGWPGRP